MAIPGRPTPRTNLASSGETELDKRRVARAYRRQLEVNALRELQDICHGPLATCSPVTTPVVTR